MCDAEITEDTEKLKAAGYPGLIEKLKGGLVAIGAGGPTKDLEEKDGKTIAHGFELQELSLTLTKKGGKGNDKT